MKTPNFDPLAVFLIVLLLPLNAAAQQLQSDDEDDNRTPTSATIPTDALRVSSLRSSTSSSDHPMVLSSPWRHSSSLFSDLFNIEDDFFDNVFRGNFRTFSFPSLVEQGEDTKHDVFQRHFFFQSPFDDLATILGSHADHHQSLKGLMDTSPHTFLRGGLGRDNSDFFSSLQPTDIQVVDDDTMYQVSMRLPEDIKFGDFNVRLEHSGTRLVIEGHSSKSNNIEGEGLEDATNVAITTTSKHFVRSFLVDPKVIEVDRFVATVQDGLLKISAPKDPRKIKNVNHVIPVENLADIRALPSTPQLELGPDVTHDVRDTFMENQQGGINRETLSEKFESVKNSLVQKRNDQMSKFTKADWNADSHDGGDENVRKQKVNNSHGRNRFSLHNIVNNHKKNQDNWRDVSETTL